jgi:hypothetical protein
MTAASAEWYTMASMHGGFPARGTATSTCTPQALHLEVHFRLGAEDDRLPMDRLGIVALDVPPAV